MAMTRTPRDYVAMFDAQWTACSLILFSGKSGYRAIGGSLWLSIFSLAVVSQGVDPKDVPIFNAFFIQAKDVFGNLRSTGGDQSSVQLAPTNQDKFNATIVTTFEDLHSEVYNCAFNVTKSGKYMAKRFSELRILLPFILLNLTLAVMF